MDLERALSTLIDDKDFLAIDQTRRRFNIFDAMGAQRAELRHSNFLSFLLSPAAPHGLGTRPLQMVLRALLDKLPPDQRPVSSLKVAISDLDDTVVHRESDYIDILLLIRDLHLAVVIENKVGAKAGDGQLERYKALIERKYPKWKKLFVYLTPTGDDPEHSEYVPFSYVELTGILDLVVEENTGAGCGEDTKLVLQHYTRMLRRHVVDDQQLRDIAIKIYERHSDALDFIFTCKPEGTSLLPSVLELLKKDKTLIEDKHQQNMLRFFPAEWEGLAALQQCPEASWTKTGRNVLFEAKSFKNEGAYKDRILLSLILGPSDTKLRKFIFDAVHQRKDVFRRAGKAIGQKWVTIYSRELLNVAEAENMDDAEKLSTIKENWQDFVASDLPKLTSAVVDIARAAPI